MRRFVDLIRENNNLRKEVEVKTLVSNMQDFVMAKSLENNAMIEEMFLVPTKEVQLFIETENVMSVNVPKMHSHIDNPYGDDNGDVVYSYLASNSEMDATLLAMEGLVEKIAALGRG